MPVARHLNNWLDWCVSGDDKTETEQMFIEEL